jgi:branched-subunit amino acid aminotransferase/4-amino-4-deoxychorismate lyase
LKKNGALYTPPVICGLLPGIFREDLLKKGQCVERILTLNDLLSADAVYCGNSVRGLVEGDIN